MYDRKNTDDDNDDCNDNYDSNDGYLIIIMTKMTKNTSKYCDFSWHDCINVTNTFVEDMNCENLLGL